MNAAFLALALGSQDPSDAVYNENTFANYRITMAAADWNAIVNDPFGAGDVWKRCSVQWQNDAAVNDVGIKAVGTNRRAGNTKPAVRLKFDEFVPGREWRGVDDIKLEGSIIEGFNERISYWTYRQFSVPAPRAVHAQVTVNNDLKGVYEVIETVRKKMVKYHLGILNPDGNLYKIDRHPNGDTTWRGDHYLWRGSTASTYVPSIWEPITNEIGGNYSDVVGLLDILNNAPQAERRTRLDGTINLDKFYSYLAVLAATGDHDSIHAGDAPSTPNNHFWYHREDTNRLQVIPWDPSNTFGPSYWLTWNEGVAMSIWFGIDPAVTSSSQWDGRTRTNTKATAWMAPDGVARAAYVSKLRQLIDGPFPNAVNYINTVNSQIRNAVVNDPYTGVTTAQYDTRVQDARNWVPARISAIRAQLPSTVTTVTITATDPNAAEPSSAGVFTITRTGSTSGALGVSVTRSGTASTSDFNALPSMVTIPAGSASATVTVTPVDDTTVESSETVILTIASNAAYTVGSPSSATVTIADNDSAPPPTLPTVTITATDPNAAEPSNVGVFTVTRTGATTSALTVQRVRSGTAVSPDDYTPLPSPFVIPAGQASVTITVAPVDDTAVEGPETMIVTLSPDPAYTVGTASSATVTIADNDTNPSLPTVTIAASDPNAAEPTDTGTFTVTRTGATTAALTVNLSRSGTAGAGDCNAMPASVTIPAGSASTTITVTPVDDTTVEGNETVILTIAANAAYVVGTASNATATIADNDTVPPPPTLPTVTITATDPNAAEPSNVGVFTLTRTGPTTTALSVVRARSGTATSGTDFNGLPSPIVIPAGQASVTVTVTPIDDTAAEANETVILTISPDPVYTVGTPSSATVTIADNDTATGTGLSGTYYDNADFTGTSVTRTDPTVDFNWADQAPAAGIGPDTFSVRWTGRVRPQFSETYTLYTFTNDGVRLWVEGELLVDHWVQQSGGIEWSAQIALQAGRWYTVQMDYYENLGNSLARLSWSSPSTPKQVIPQSALDPALGAPDSRDNDGDGIPNDTDLDDDNDGIPDLEDPDRDGDGSSNLVEISSGTDPDDRTSLPGGPGGGVPTSQRGGENENGDAWINDRCAGGSIPAPGPGWVGGLLLLPVLVLSRRRTR